MRNVGALACAELHVLVVTVDFYAAKLKSLHWLLYIYITIVYSRLNNTNNNVNKYGDSEDSRNTGNWLNRAYYHVPQSPLIYTPDIRIRRERLEKTNGCGGRVKHWKQHASNKDLCPMDRLLSKQVKSSKEPVNTPSVEKVLLHRCVANPYTEVLPHPVTITRTIQLSPSKRAPGSVQIECAVQIKLLCFSSQNSCIFTTG